MGFVHLNVHSEYSLLSSTIQIKNLFSKLKELNMNTVAITDNANMYACITKYKLAKKSGIKLIFGADLYIVPDMLTKEKTEKRYRLIVLAKDNTGYKNLMKITSIANNEGFYYKPRIDKNILKKYSNGLIAIATGFNNEIARSALENNEKKCLDLISEYQNIFSKENFFLGIENHNILEEEKVRNFYKKLQQKIDIKIVATNNSHYLEKEDKYPHEVMLCIQSNQTITNPNHFKFQGNGFHLKSEEEMQNLFSDFPDSCNLSQKIADMCNVDIQLDKPTFPTYIPPENKTHENYIRELCEKSLEIKYGNSSLFSEAKKRMNYELKVIIDMGFAPYFLIVQDFISYAKTICQVGPGRGSGAGSIVAYLLGITQLEPLSLNLLFERFLNPERISLPDFDVDFGDKDKVLKYIREKYGSEKVALIGTFGTMMAKAVLKDVARAMDIPFATSNEITKFVNEKTIEESLKEQKELQNYQKHYPDLFFVAKKLEGSVRHTGVHACGVVWGKEEINYYIPTIKRHDEVITQLDWRDCEAAGLVKFDMLGLETLNITKNILDMINKDNTWLENISLEDQHVYQMLQKGDSIGVFQLESAGMQKTLKFVKPICFDDIIAIVALYRPGSMDFIEVYARRKDGKEKVIYPDAKAEPILKSTYGIIVYQEQVMELSQKLAGFTLGEADVLRKAIGKKIKELMDSQETKFKEGCKTNTQISEKSLNDLWATIVKFASYSFNKSHAAAYALIAYRTAYLKYYYPVEFMCATLTSTIGNPDKMSFYLESAKDIGITILPPNINKSKTDFSVTVDNNSRCILFGLNGIKNVGDSVLHEIITKRPFSSFQDFIDRVDLSKVNKRVIHNLIAVGCFDNLGKNRAQLLAIHDKIKKNNSQSQQMTLFGTTAHTVTYPNVEDISLKEKLELEKELIGVYVSAHPLDLYIGSNSHRFDKLGSLKENVDIEIMGIIKDYKKITTRNMDEMCFLTIKDKFGEGKIVIFPDLFRDKLKKREIKGNECIIIEGKLKIDDKGENILASNIKFAPLKQEYSSQRY